MKRFGAKQVEAGGLQVRTTLDPRMQYAARAAVGSVLRVKTDPAAALVAIDPRTGAVKAMVSYLPDGRPMKFNLASQSGRTAGSAFKPFTLATAIDQGVSVYTGLSGPSQLTITDPKCAFNGVQWDVHNYADESGGYMNLARRDGALRQHDLRAARRHRRARRTSCARHASSASRRSCSPSARSRSARRRSIR